MTSAPGSSVDAASPTLDGWPVSIDGVLETIVATRGPNGDWNQAALGIEPSEHADGIDPEADTPAQARTFGRTRTRRNFSEGQPAFVQFTADPAAFVEAALGVVETEKPILESSAAWTEVEPQREAGRTEQGTEVVEWSLKPLGSRILAESVPTLSRGRAAVIEATVHASRLGVEGHEDAELIDRLLWLDEIVATAGNDRSTAAFERIDELVGWREHVQE